MTEFSREILKTDEVMSKLFEVIKSNHRVAKHTQETLFQNRFTENFCEEARHFCMLGGKNPIYLHYDVSSWYKASYQASIRIESIGIYDSFMEYEIARMKELHSASKADIPNIN